MLKEYVIDLRGYDGKLRELISTGLQEHAFRLGWVWGFDGKVVQFTKSAILYFHGDGLICQDNDMKIRGTITPADFLALTPEDVQENSGTASAACTEDKSKLKSGDRVLVRYSKHMQWRFEWYSHKNNGGSYICVGDDWPECIPYEGNEHLCGQVGEPK